jgi:hypothetical protein
MAMTHIAVLYFQKISKTFQKKLLQIINLLQNINIF